MVILMKEELYLKRAKHLLNSDLNQNVFFEEYINGPMEEPILLAYDVDIDKFIKYRNNLKIKRNKWGYILIYKI